MPRPARKWLTRQELASALGVSAGTITRWQRDGMPTAKKLPRGRASLFDLAAVRSWHEAVTAAIQSGGSLSLTDERAKLARAQRQKLEREAAVAARQLIPVDEVVRAGQLQVTAWRAKVLGLARKLVSSGAIPRECEARVKEGCRDLLTEISEWRGFEDGEDGEAA